MKAALLAFSIVGFVVSADSSAQEKKDIEKLEGKWVVVSVEREGKVDDALKGAVRLHSGSKYTLTPKNGKTIAGTFKIDTTKKPHVMDMTPAEGRYKDKTLLGIYELTGDTLKICFAEPGKDRPTEFASKSGSGAVLAVHQRDKP